MRRVGVVFLVLFLGVVLGVASAVLVLREGLRRSQLAKGPWRTSLSIGTSSASAYTRARVALGGLLALAPSETIYFNADHDEQGALLEARCDYRLEGGELAARWWSITAYGADHYLVPNDVERYSYAQTTLARERDGSWLVHVSPLPHAGNWLPSGRRGTTAPFALTLRLYNPEPGVREHPTTTPLPRIVREGCR